MTLTIEDLKGVFYNVSRSLEIFYLMHDLKNVVRLDANTSELLKIERFCTEHDLYFVASDFKVVKVVDSGKGAFSNTVKVVSANSPEDGLHHLYISKEKAKADFLKLLEAKQDDKAVGELLGYPSCCIDFFEAHKKEQQKHQNDFILPAAFSSEGNSFSFLLNHAARYFDATLLSHFPHSFSCEESLKIAQERFDLLQEKMPSVASDFERILKKPILYTETDGVFIFDGGDLKDGVFSFDIFKSTSDSALSQKLHLAKKFTVTEDKKIVVGTEEIRDACLLFFT